MAYKASMQERFHRNFNSRIRTDANTLVRTTGIAANLEALYLFNGDARSRPGAIPNLIQNTHNITMIWNGDGYLLGEGGIKLADNGNAVTNTACLVTDLGGSWSPDRNRKSRVFVVNMEWKTQSLAQCYIVQSNGLEIFRSSTGTVFTINMENKNSHRASWTIDTAAFKDGDPVTIVVCGDYSTNTSICYINGVSLGNGVLNGDPFGIGLAAEPSVNGWIGRASSWPDYYGFDGKIGLYGFSFNFPGNVPPTNAELKALSIDPYRTLLNTQRSKIDLPDILLPVAADWEIEFEARCDSLPTNDNLMPLLTATDYAPNTQKGLSLQAAGNTAYGTIPGWTRQYGTGARWSVEIEFELTELSNIIHLLGASASTISQFLRVEVNGVIGVRNSGLLTLQSAAGAIQANKRYLVKVAREDDTLAKLYIDDMVTPVATCPIADIPTVDTNQIGRYSTTIHTPTFILYRLKFSNDSGTGSTSDYYSAEWNSSTIPSDDFALNWPSVGATHNITITNATVGIDPYYTRTPYMAGLFTNSAGQIVWTEGTNNYTTGGFAAGIVWSTNSSRYLALPSWSATAASVWSIETEFMVYENNIGAGTWSIGILTNNGSSFLNAVVSTNQTSFYLEAKNNVGTVVTTTASIPFVIGKWYKVKLESTNADWVITVDDVERSRIANTTASPTLERLLGTTVTPTIKAVCRSFVITGGTYAATWNTTNTTGKGTVWTSTNGLRTISPFGTFSNAYHWYDLRRRRFISESEVVLPKQRHFYKISKVGTTFTVRRSDTRVFEAAWTQTKDLYLNRMVSCSTNGIEYGNSLQLYSLRVGTETWIPNATALESSVGSGRNATLSGASLVNIPDPYVYCPTNGQTYANFGAVPAAVVDLPNVVFEVSGFLKSSTAIRFNQSTPTKVTVRAVPGQEFSGKIYDDNVATVFTIDAFDSGIGSNTNNQAIDLNGILVIPNLLDFVGAFGTYFPGQQLTATNTGILTHYNNNMGGASVTFGPDGTSSVILNSCLIVGEKVTFNGGVAQFNRVTVVPTHPTSTSITPLASGISLSNSVIVKPNQFTNNCVPSGITSVTNTATNDASGSYGLFAALTSFVDQDEGDFRLKPESGLYKAGIGAFSPTYVSPITVYGELTGVLLSAPTTHHPYAYAKYVIDTSDDFTGSFSTSISVDASITLFSKESNVTKPDNSSNVDLTVALAKEVGVAKSATSANFDITAAAGKETSVSKSATTANVDIAATAAKEATLSKPNTQINTDIAGLAATKEALSSITLLANISTSYLYQIIYDIGGSFSSLITVSTSKVSTKSVNSVKTGTSGNVDVSGVGATKTADSTKQNVSASSDFVIGSGSKTPSASKPGTQVNVDALAAAVKDVGTIKVNSSILADIMSLASKEVGYQKPAMSASVDFASFLYEISYGITGSFTSVVLASLVLQATKEALSQKPASSGGFSGVKVATKESSSQKPASSANISTSKVSTKAINSGMYSEASTATQYNWAKQAISSTYAEISLSWEIFGTAKDVAKKVILLESDYSSVFEFYTDVANTAGFESNYTNTLKFNTKESKWHQ